MTFTRSSDRDIIQARRALFVATALSTLSGGARAELPKKPECNRAEPAGAERLDEAKSLVKEGMELSQQAIHEEALDRFERAFELTPHPKIALLVADEWQVLGSPNDVVIWANAALECGLEGDDRARAERSIESAKAGAGEIQLRIDPNGSALVETVMLDDRVIDPAAKLYLTPGRHVFDVLDDQGRHVKVEIEVVAGDSRVVEVTLEPAVTPRVCLQPLPCLSPPPPPDPREESRVLLDVGAFGLVDVDGDAYRNHGLGGALGVGLSMPLSRRGLRTFVGLEASPSKLRSGSFLPLGGRLEAAVPLGLASVGLGVGAGWVVVSGDESNDETRRPRSSAFVEPYLPIDFWLGDHVGIELRTGFLLGQQESVSDEAFRLGFLRTGVFLRYAFGSSEEELVAGVPPPGL